MCVCVCVCVCVYMCVYIVVQFVSDPVVHSMTSDTYRINSQPQMAT